MRKYKLEITVGVICAIIGLLYIDQNYSRNVHLRDQALAEKAADVCRGHAISGAASYSTERSLHPIVFSTQNGAYDWNYYDKPERWRTSSISELQLVACFLGPGEQTGQTCSYGSVDTFSTSTESQKVELFEAKTGRIIDERWFSSAPVHCPFIYKKPGWDPNNPTKSFEASVHSENVFHSHISHQEVLNWLGKYVSP